MHGQAGQHYAKTGVRFCIDERTIDSSRNPVYSTFEDLALELLDAIRDSKDAQLLLCQLTWEWDTSGQQGRGGDKGSDGAPVRRTLLWAASPLESAAEDDGVKSFPCRRVIAHRHTQQARFQRIEPNRLPLWRLTFIQRRPSALRPLPAARRLLRWRLPGLECVHPAAVDGTDDLRPDAATLPAGSARRSQALPAATERAARRRLSSSRMEV